MRAAALFLVAVGCGEAVVDSTSSISILPVSISLPLAGSRHEQGLLTVTGSVSTASVSVEVRIGAGAFAVATSSGSAWVRTIDTSTLPIGLMTIEARMVGQPETFDTVTIELVRAPFDIDVDVAIGASSMELRASSSHPGRIYYAVQPFDPGPLEAGEIRELANSGGSFAGGSMIAPANVTLRARIDGLLEETPYWIYVAAESDSEGLGSTVFVEHRFTGVRQAALVLPTTTATVGYWAYFPEEYYFDETRDFPTLIFFHGVGEIDDGTPHAIFKVLLHGPPRMIRGGNDFEMIVLSPQATQAVGYQIEWMDEFVEQAKLAHRIDDRAIYATGLSLGGHATWLYTQAHPEKIAAAIPIAAWLDDLSAACAMSSVAIWAFHGADDDLILPARAVAPIDAINACDPPPAAAARMTVYPSGGHLVWERTYENTATPENIWDWLLRQQKP